MNTGAGSEANVSNPSGAGPVHDPALPLAGHWQRLAGAVLAPPEGPERPQPCGVFHAGAPVAQSLCFGADLTDPVTVFPATAPAPKADLPGCWLFGGVLSGHFGHMLCEATARLWALDDPGLQDPVDGIVFFARPFDKVRPAHTGFARLALLLDLPKVVVIEAPTRVENLILPEQGFGTETLLTARPETRRFLRDRLARIAPAGTGRRLFLTRSGQPARRGRVLDEAGLEPLFAAAGYEVIRPEDHSLAAQVAMFRGASHIVAAEGSALHLVSFAAPDGAKVAAIRRRVSPVFDQICDSLEWFMGQPPLALTMLRSVHAPQRARNANLVVLEPARGQMSQDLAAAGFLPAGTRWPELTDAERAVALAALQEETGRALHPAQLADLSQEETET